MDPGDLLLLGAFAFAGAALGSALLHARRGGTAVDRRATLLACGAVALTGLAWLTLLARFLARDTSLYTVWAYSDDATPLYLRVAGTWAGSAGSVFLWTLALGLCLVAEELWRRRARARGVAEADGALPAAVRAVALAVFVAFVFLTLRAMPFAATADFHFDGGVGFFTYQPGLRGLPTPLDFRAQGFGLNPLLLTPFMAIHPPFEFAAYALVAMPFAFAVAGLVTRDARWSGGAVQWARWAWLCYAIALGLGALWAYYVLSFGGYWVWDPVEVADLIPFLGLTVFLHAADAQRKGRGWDHYAPFLAALVFPLTLFGTFVTRSSYWISAHAFDVGSAAIVQDPATRLLQVVAAKPEVAAFLALLLVVLGGLAALHLLRLARATWTRRALSVPALALLAAYLLAMAYAALDVRGFLNGGFGLAGALGGGNALLGIAVLGLALVALPVALMVLALPEGEAEPFDPRALLEADMLMNAGIVLLSLGLLVTVALLLLGVNFTVGQLGRFFRDREPLVVLPLVLVLTLRLGVKNFGKERAALLAFAAGAVGLLLFLALPQEWRLLGLGVPVLSVALGAALVQLLKAASKGSSAPREAQLAGTALVAAGLCGVAMWASPPTALALGGGSVQVPLAYVPLGLGAAMACYLLGIAVLQGEAPRLAVLGGILAMAAFGYGLGALLGVAALVLGLRGRWSADRPLHSALARHKGRYYGASRWAAHLAILLVFAGYGASAYHAVEADYHDVSDPLVRGVPRAFGDYTLTLTDSAGVDPLHNHNYTSVTAFLELRRGGQVLDVAPLTFYWVDKESQYRATEHVFRGPLEDVYVNSNPSNLPALHTPDGWVASNQGARFAAGQPVEQLHSAQVDQVALSVKRLPLVAPLWAGAVLLPFTMAVTIACAPPRGFVKAAKKEEAVPALLHASPG